MKKRNVILLTLTLAGAAFVTLNTTDANAQGRRNRGGRNGGQNGGANGGQNGGANGGQNGRQGGAGFGGQNGGGRNGRGGQFGAMRGAQHDPTRTAIPILIPREDVVTEIMLSQKQTEEFAAEEKTEQDAMMQKMQDARKAMQTPAAADGQTLTKEEQQAKRTEARQKMTDMMTEARTAQTDAIEKKAETILRPEQLTRIHQLDLQWRGPLALTDKKVGDKFNLTAEQKTALADLLKNSQAEQQKVMRDAMTALRPPRQRRNNNAAAAAPGATPTDPNAPATPPAANATPTPAPLTQEEIQAKMTEAIGKADKIRLDYDAKAVALLTESQKAAWKAATGAKFTFRQPTN